MYQSEFSYDFTSDVLYARDGKQECAKSLTIKAPTAAVLNDFASLDVMVQKADSALIKEQQNLLLGMSQEKIDHIQKLADQFKSQKKEEQKKTGTQLVNELCAGGFDFGSAMRLLISILIESKAKIDGVSNITNVVIASISMADMKELLGQYIQNFLLQSRE